MSNIARTFIGFSLIFLLFGCASVRRYSDRFASKETLRERTPASNRLCGKLFMNGDSPYLRVKKSGSDTPEELYWIFREGAPRHEGFLSILSTYDSDLHGGIRSCFNNPTIEDAGNRKILSNWDEDIDGFYLSCFVAGTLVSTPSGPIAIERLKVGDLVLSFDGQGIVESKVLKTMSMADQLYGSISTSSGTTLKVTAGHPFYDLSKEEWFRIANASDERVLGELRERTIHPASVTNIDFSSRNRTTVYNIEVDVHHNYFAEGILVHNK